MRSVLIFTFLTILAAPMIMALGADPVTTTTLVAAPVIAHPADASQDFLVQVLDAVKNFGGLSAMLKISTVILLIVASMKVSFLNQYVWSKLGEAQAWVPIFLSLVAGVLSLGGALTLPAALAYLSTGVGAVGLHELLDSLKAIPGLGAVYVGAIDFVEKMLGGPASKA